MHIEGTLEKIQDSIEKYLISINELRNIPVLTYKQSDLESILDVTIRSGIGVAVVLMPPIANDVIRHIRGPIFNNLLIEIQIIEDPAMNKSGNSLLSIAESVMEHLHGWSIKICEISYRIELADGNQACQAKREDGKNIFFIRFSTPLSLENHTIIS